MEDRSPETGARLGAHRGGVGYLLSSEPRCPLELPRQDRPLLPNEPVPRQPIRQQITGVFGTAV